MQNVNIPVPDDVNRILNDLIQHFQTSSDAETIHHALRLSQLVASCSSDGVARMVNSENKIVSVRLSANPYASILSENARFRGVHAGQRGFILCNGESIKQQDLTPLRNEIVMTVSNGYLHNDYKVIRPRYHCLPQITYTPIWTRETTVSWFREMHDQVLSEVIFLSASECALIQEEKLFPGRDVRYVDMRLGMAMPTDGALFDITRTIPSIQSSPILCLMLMMYMGFKEIYLIGTDHDQIQKGFYKYPFEPRAVKDADHSVDAAGRPTESMFDQMNSMISLWTQYRVMKYLANRNGIKIYNSSNGGMLDEFKRIPLESLF
ncbi:hypothetical protein J2847_006638 [Azospirillum agricola]|uniref:hypothetical protein n=1 Tax=Azospirillum agricola TaxID=1720247 RepID=UPI001AE2C4DE|nr:hypothetical protein [Azospirillum agricola]MBP2233301.1 hypothetical protein [Azospirillum agricola]